MKKMDSEMVDEMGHTVSYREVRTTKYFYFLYKSQHSGRRAKQFLILKAIKMDIKRIFNGCHIPIPHENSTYNTENAHEILIFLNSSLIYVILVVVKIQLSSETNRLQIMQNNMLRIIHRLRISNRINMLELLMNENKNYVC